MFLRRVCQNLLQEGITKLHLSDQGVSAESPDTASAPPQWWHQFIRRTSQVRKNRLVGLTIFISLKEGPKTKEAILLYRHSRLGERNLGVENR